MKMVVQKVDSSRLFLEELAWLLGAEIQDEPESSKTEKCLLLAEQVIIADEIKINPPSK